MTKYIYMCVCVGGVWWVGMGVVGGWVGVWVGVYHRMIVSRYNYDSGSMCSLSVIRNTIAERRWLCDVVSPKRVDKIPSFMESDGNFRNCLTSPLPSLPFPPKNDIEKTEKVK